MKYVNIEGFHREGFTDVVATYISRRSHLEYNTCNHIQAEPHMLKILPVIPANISQKITHYSYFILTSLPIIPILFFCIIMFQV